MKKTLIYTLCFTLVSALFPSLSQANQDILVSPNRIVFAKGKDKRPKVFVSNPSDKTRRYRISLVNKRMREDGSFEDVEKGDTDGNFANKMIRFSPRSFTLAPKTARPVLLKLRKPKGMEDGEYRTHLLVQVVPEGKLPDFNDEGKLAIAVKVNYGIAIPVIVKNGELSVDVNVTEVAVEERKDENDPNAVERTFLKTTFTRDGTESAYGDISVMFTDNSGEEHLLKQLQGIALYPEISKRELEIPLEVPNDLKVKNGKLSVKYLQDADDGGEEYSSKEINL